ncbi:MAG: right-handed parallel beta-helix repeat-containing protein, partial [Candidatus Hecatellaceae archaeon]
NYIGLYLLRSSENSIDGNVHRNDAYGIYLDLSNGNRIEDVKVDESRLRGIVIAYSSDVYLKGNKIQGSPINIYLLNARNINFEGNTTKGGDYGLYLERSRDITISKGEIMSHSRGMVLSYSSSVTIRDNRFTDNFIAIHIKDSRDNRVEENVFTENSHSIYLTKSVRNIITANKFKVRSEGYNAMVFENHSDANIVQGNDFCGNKAGGSGNSIGLKFLSSISNRVIENSIHDHHIGVYLDKNSHENDVKENHFYNNDHDIWIEK